MRMLLRFRMGCIECPTSWAGVPVSIGTAPVANSAPLHAVDDERHLLLDCPAMQRNEGPIFRLVYKA